MSITQRQYARITELICDQLWQLQKNRYHDLQRGLSNLETGLYQLQRLRCLLEKCARFNWHDASRKLSGRIETLTEDLPHTITDLDRLTKLSKTVLPTPRTIYEDLRQAEQDFNSVEYDRSENTLSAFTEPIELEGLFLGEFEIKLRLDQLGEMPDGRIVRIVALDPHPASSNESVTHPHVSDECLCTGDATVPLNLALANGRITDAFMIVRAVLETYNPGSPYVALSDWEGASCYECSYTICEDDTYYCENCDNSFCDECSSCCECCDITFCKQCMQNCPACEEDVCGSCLCTCVECGEQVCNSCIEENICPTCKKERDSDEEETNKNVSEVDKQIA
jgi:hypothetical protein